MMTKTYYLESRDDNRAVKIGDDGIIHVCDAPAVGAAGVSRVACTLNTEIVRQMSHVAAEAGFTVRNDSMLVR